MPAPKLLAGAVTFCEALLMDGESGVVVAKVCGKRADKPMLAPSGETVFVCDEHAADFTPEKHPVICEVPR